MNCYDCGKFLKKGHGKNLYWYAGEWRYFCFFCLKVSDFHWRVNKRRKEYSSLVTLLSLGLAGLIFWLVYKQVNQNLIPNTKPEYLLAIILALLPIIGGVVIWFVLIKPNLNELSQEEWKPLGQEKEKLKLMENYVNSLNRAKESCLCEKCLLMEWNKRKISHA